MHPRTRQRLETSGLWSRLSNAENFRLIDPVGYLDFVCLLDNARLVLTDSGGIQEETTIMKVPCITLRENTERPITVEMGTNQIAGVDPERILAAYERALALDPKSFGQPPLWDGHAAERIVAAIGDRW